MTGYTTLIDAQTLAQHYQDPDWVVIDCRFDLTNPDWGYASYLQEHIPGAAFADLEKDLSGKITAQTGRHPLPVEAQFIGVASRLGIDSSKQVVVYDTNVGEIASRLWWMLGLFNHPHVALLDGGFTQWKKLDLPVKSGVETHKPTQFNGTPNWDGFATSVQVETYIHSPYYRLIDSRAHERFTGEVEPLHPVAGHIPSAGNLPYMNNIDPQGKFKPAEEIRKNFAHLMQNVTPGNVVIYCGSGVTGCLNILASKVAGIEGPRLYAGSWSEWIRDPRREIAKG
jgi:thiosulfate/3-mercaptopyruvate sulfurtransferase